MLNEFLLMWIRFYPILSVFIFVLVVVSANIKSKTSTTSEEDKEKEIKELQKNIDQLRMIFPKIANYIEYIVIELLNGNNGPILMLILIASFIPFFRIGILIMALPKSKK